MSAFEINMSPICTFFCVVMFFVLKNKSIKCLMTIQCCCFYLFFFFSIAKDRQIYQIKVKAWWLCDPCILVYYDKAYHYVTYKCQVSRPSGAKFCLHRIPGFLQMWFHRSYCKPFYFCVRFIFVFCEFRIRFAKISSTQKYREKSAD